MKRLLKKADNKAKSFNPALYNDDEGKDLKQEVITFIEESIEPLGVENSLENYTDGSVDGDIEGKTIIKWVTIENQYGKLEEWDKETIINLVETIDELEDVFIDELQDEAGPGYEVTDINLEFSETEDGIVIEYTGDVHFDAEQKRNHNSDF